MTEEVKISEEILTEESNGSRRGRPPGVQNGDGQPHEIAKWKPIHEQIVMLHLLGKKNVEIAAIVERTTASVGQVLSTRQAHEMIHEGKNRLQEFFVENVEERLIALGPRAVTNLAETIEAEGLNPGSAAKKHQDGVSLELLNRIGFTKQDRHLGGEGTLGQMDKDLQERLVAALEKSTEKEKFDSVQEASWEELDSEELGPSELEGM